MTDGWIGVDLDGTLAQYDGWKNTFEIGPPIPRMIERVKQWRKEGIEVRIFTARVDGGTVAHNMGVDLKLVLAYGHIESIKRMINVWCYTHIGEILPVTCKKDYGMIELWDDRCVQVERNTGRRIDGKD
jgi:hypothetical protein